jgi:DJ-1 family protein
MIYVFIAHGFEEIEAITTIDILRRAGLTVQTVGVGAKTITGAHDITIHCDMAERMVSKKNLQMIVLPGGMPGTTNLQKSPTVQKVIDYAFANDVWVGAICAAPSILGQKGLLDGKKVTCFPGFEQDLGAADFTGAPVEQDGKLITANGPGNALAFALRLVQCLTDTETAENLAKDMKWNR